MGLFSALSVANRSSKGPCYNGSNRYVRDIVCFSEEFLTAAGKTRPTPEERFNAILSLTAIILGYSCHKFVRLKDFDGGAIASEVRSLLGELLVNPELLSQNEVELDNLQRSLDLQLKKRSHYSGDVVANLLLRSRGEQFIYGSQDANIVDIPIRARDYALLTIKAYRQETVPLVHLSFLFNAFILAALTGYGYKVE